MQLESLSGTGDLFENGERVCTGVRYTVTVSQRVLEGGFPGLKRSEGTIRETDGGRHLFPLLEKREIVTLHLEGERHWDCRLMSYDAMNDRAKLSGVGMPYAVGSRATVTFQGGTDEEHRQVERALAAAFNDEKMVGGVHVSLHRSPEGWTVVQALSYPSSVGERPSRGDASDETDSVTAALLSAGIVVSTGR